MNPKVDFYFNKADKWQNEVIHLRSIILDCGLTEELKWGVPCYTYQNANIVLIHTFKEYCALLFFKGSLMSDPNSLLIQQTENVQGARQIRFTGAAQIKKMEKILKAYVYEAIEVEKAGLKVDLKNTGATIPDEFRQKLNRNAELKSAFYGLTPGRQRAYLLHFAQPKLPKTREARIEKFIPHILRGKGMYDR